MAKTLRTHFVSPMTRLVFAWWILFLSFMLWLGGQNYFTTSWKGSLKDIILCFPLKLTLVEFVSMIFLRMFIYYSRFMEGQISKPWDNQAPQTSDAFWIDKLVVNNNPNIFKKKSKKLTLMNTNQKKKLN